MRTKLIAGNWKMNTTLADAVVLATGVRNGVEHMERIEVMIAPPTIWLAALAHDVIPPRHMPHLKLGAQNMYFEESGAFTGEISPLMVKEVAEYVILGHSDRTHKFHENAELISEKVLAALNHDLVPVLCLGEDEKSADSKRQLVHKLNHLLKGFTPDQIKKIVVAYEPVWAISGGDASHEPATPEYAAEVIAGLRSVLPEETRVLYGGSSNDENAQSFFDGSDCDGFLVGGASLKLKSFLTMCQVADDIAQAQGHKSLHV
jgi:triosephosphate isomerase